ncbi:MAG: 2-amino-4-oxopentanoate thiolase subunit OrtA [Clostridium sp.]|uniref:2-amino-4-oxopentanoate thiolase subunit OrtA n=1 Tax=Clostridium sp. TaxID=1506 RepID=UPI0030657E96
MIKKGTFVEVETIVLECSDRSPAIPEDTKKTPLKMWVRGFVNSDCSIGEEVEITTTVGRIMKGMVKEVEPGYSHGFGRYVSEIAYIGKQAKEMLFQ